MNTKHHAGLHNLVLLLANARHSICSHSLSTFPWYSKPREGRMVWTWACVCACVAGFVWVIWRWRVWERVRRKGNWNWLSTLECCRKGRNRVRKKNENEVIQPSPILWHQRNFLSRMTTGPEEGESKLKFVPCSVRKVFPHLRGSCCL